ncbi:hypothetical protein COMNV_01117 [Commensalibacter sp. Nvir]|uniref:thioredoxin domain-containing protein n=1 Tax=Commensalibacter sp. Nvir TaxID=3069817 RepID=UPI002D6CAF63|nr:hypothetical protein COMNV_01117 [Commensalibacter sp. Nvir]
MPITRRALMTTALPTFSLFAFTSRVKADEPFSNFSSIRALGNLKAGVHVQEWFSITCAHCADFAQKTLPAIKKDYIDTGKVYYIFRDFPLDRVALAAAIVARSLPIEQYEPFVMVLLQNLEKWVFADGVDPMAELKKYAILAGMSPDRFQQVIQDKSLENIIMNEVKTASEQYKINSTPTFVFNEKPHVGELSFEDFGKLVGQA